MFFVSLQHLFVISNSMQNTLPFIIYKDLIFRKILQIICKISLTLCMKNRTMGSKNPNKTAPIHSTNIPQTPSPITISLPFEAVTFIIKWDQ